jgi:hypothetical protein
MSGYSSIIKKTRKLTHTPFHRMRLAHFLLVDVDLRPPLFKNTNNGFTHYIYLEFFPLTRSGIQSIHTDGRPASSEAAQVGTR